MKNFEKMAIVRHLEDINNLKEFGLDGILKPNQERESDKISKELIDLAVEEGAEVIDIFSSNQNRASETARKLDESINSIKPGFSKLNIDKRIRDLNQGTPNLPGDYSEGQDFEPLRDAWNIFWDETFVKKDLLYRFGSPESSDGIRKFPELEGAFSEYGECYAQLAERLYDFTYELFTQEKQSKPNNMIGLVGHSITFGVMHELAVISKDYTDKFPNKPIPLGELPKITWEYFDKLKKGVLNKNPEYGEINFCDITKMKDEIFLENLSVERDVLRGLMKQSNVQY